MRHWSNVRFGCLDLAPVRGHVLSGLLTLVTSACAASAETPPPRFFDIASADGTLVHGQVDLPARPGFVAVIMVAGTGEFDRDTAFGRTGTPRDKLFKDLAGRITARGGIAVRYDKRGIGYTGGGPVTQDRALLAKTTTTAMWQDLSAVYGWTRAQSGLGARCVVVFAHSEGMVHVGRLAASGAPAPALVIGMGAAMQSPMADIRWQETERDAYSLKMMDTDHDGVTTNDEVEANWRRTPSGAFDTLVPFLHPNGRWTQADLDRVRERQTARYEQEKLTALALPDDSPYPNSSAPFAASQWWKSWFLDDTPVAKNLSGWKTRLILHYGTYDSQTYPDVEVPAAKAFLPRDALTIEIHPGGHSLGKHPLYGPIDEQVADRIADEAMAACNR
jgi:hypothetical protein